MEMTKEEALEIIRRDEARKQKKREALNRWRQQHRAEYNDYIRRWRAERKAKAATSRAKPVIRRTTVDIDGSKFARVREVLGADTLRETVDRSFDEVLARAAREASIARLQQMKGLDLNKPDVMKRAWR